MSMPTISDKTRNSMNASFTEAEFKTALFNMKNNKSPGPDGFTAEFYKSFWKDLCPFLIRSFMHGKNVKNLSNSQKEGVISLLPKGNKPRNYIKNWRPISLLNVSYKILSSCIANRIKLALNEIIATDQKGFVKGRFIGDNIRLLIDLLSYVDNEDLPGILLVADFEKAFDTLYRNFIWNTLDSFDFGSSLIDWCKLLYNDTRSSVLVNGYMSPYFKINRGCRQGDPLSPYLFILSIEVLCIAIRNNDMIKGIRVNDTHLKLSLYADDAIFFLDGSEQSLLKCMNVVQRFSSFSGLNLNVSKSSLIWIGSKKNCGEKLCDNIPFLWNDGSSFEYLGIQFSLDINKMITVNYDKVLKSINNLVDNWSRRNLTVLGKVVVVKTILLSKITYVASVLPNPCLSTITSLNSIFYKFLWGGHDRIKRKQMIQNYKNGGVKMIDIFSYIKSLKLKWIQRILTSNDNWVKLFYFNFRKLFSCNSLFEIDINCLGNLVENYNNLFWKEALMSFVEFLSINKYNYDEDADHYSICYNDMFKIGNRTFFNSQMYAAGFRCVSDLLDDNGNFYTWDMLHRRCKINIDFLTYYGIIQCIRNALKLNNDNISKSYKPYLPYSASLIIKSCYDKHFFYDSLSKNLNYDPLSRTKWNAELGVNFDVSEWGEICKRPFKITKETKLQWFQFRLINRILSCNKYLFKINKRDNDLCCFCNTET